ncbi:hypothetical protein V498_10271, partial [Pseudogymnoascus sp. VKM F-4517 (FW-2822)]
MPLDEGVVERDREPITIIAHGAKSHLPPTPTRTIERPNQPNTTHQPPSIHLHRENDSSKKQLQQTQAHRLQAIKKGKHNPSSRKKTESSKNAARTGVKRRTHAVVAVTPPWSLLIVYPTSFPQHRTAAESGWNGIISIQVETSLILSGEGETLVTTPPVPGIGSRSHPPAAVAVTALNYIAVAAVVLPPSPPPPPPHLTAHLTSTSPSTPRTKHHQHNAINPTPPALVALFPFGFFLA